MTSCGIHGHEVAGYVLDPWLVMPLGVSLVLYLIGWSRLGWGLHRRAVCYLVAWSTLVAALVTPFHELAEHSFAFHMVEHEIIMAVSAPLFVAARPYGVLLWGLPETLRAKFAHALRRDVVRNAWRFLRLPLSATLVQGAVIWLWHVPGVFDATVNSLPVHRWQHLSFLVSALLFWYAVSPAYRAGQALACVFFTMLHTSILGALLALAPRVLYPMQTLHAGEWGLSALEDQQLAGMLMWVPAGTVYVGAALFYAMRWIRSGSHVVAPATLATRGNQGGL